MITNTETSYDEVTGKVKLRNTADYTSEINEARIARELNPSGRFGDKNSECHFLGTIPEEMWVYDPWLMCAKKAQLAGDNGKYSYYVKKFFQVHPCFCGGKETKYWNGHRAVLL